MDFALKVLNWDDDTLIRLQLWDIAGNKDDNVFIVRFAEGFVNRKQLDS